MKHISFFSLAALALMAGACMPATPEIPPTPVTLSLDDLNRVPPADVLEEVYFFSGGAGGGGGCEWDEDYSTPKVGLAPDVVEKMQLIEIDTCGWSADENIEVYISLPNGTKEKQALATNSFGELWFEYVVGWEDQEGVYGFNFRNQEVNLEHDVEVTHPEGPRLYLSKDRAKLYFYQFKPTERVRFFLYDFSHDKMIGWLELKMSKDGSLVMNVPVDNEVHYAAIGDISGQVLFLYEGWSDDLGELRGWNTGDVYCKDAPIQKPKYKGGQIVEVIVPELTGYFADDNDDPDWSRSVTLKQGSLIDIWPSAHHPICKDNMFWWWGNTGLYPDKTIWIPEGKGDQFYIKVVE